MFAPGKRGAAKDPKKWNKDYYKCGIFKNECHRARAAEFHMTALFRDKTLTAKLQTLQGALMKKGSGILWTLVRLGAG